MCVHLYLSAHMCLNAGTRAWPEAFDHPGARAEGCFEPSNVGADAPYHLEDREVY